VKGRPAGDQGRLMNRAGSIVRAAALQQKWIGPSSTAGSGLPSFGESKGFRIKS